MPENNTIIIAIVGMAGSGKTEVCNYLVKKGYPKIYFGDITFEELRKRALPINEKNERKIREELRRKYGMAAYAMLNLPKIKKLLRQKSNPSAIRPRAHGREARLPSGQRPLISMPSTRCRGRVEDGVFNNKTILLESLYSWEEYEVIKKEFGDKFKVLAVQASPMTRYARLKERPKRPLTEKEAQSRDEAQVENSHIAGPIAMADAVVVNEGNKKTLFKETEKALTRLLKG